MTQWGVDLLFNPGKRHLDEEKRRLQSTRHEIGDSSGGDRIDLESGKVKIKRDRTEAAQATGEPVEPVEPVEPAEAAPVSEAAARARARRRSAR